MASSTVRYVTRDQVFTMTLSGLMPLTVHYVYMDNNLIASSSIKPEGGRLEDVLKTDLNGQVTFDFYYTGGLLADSTPWAESEKIQASLAASKRIVVASKSISTLDSDYTSTYLWLRPRDYLFYSRVNQRLLTFYQFEPVLVMQGYFA